MRGSDFLDIASQMADRPEEAWVRNRIGRLYYGTYLEFREHFERFFGFDRTRLSNEHVAVQDLLGHLSQQLSINLKDLRKMRNAADYDLDLSDETLATLVESAEDAAGKLMRFLNDLRKSPTPPPR